ncbi:MAG: SoxR reducing system RseC family protein [Gammaproteobacteria bacterium]|nr:SoxR reducing system RseC family protein [Gammaproteobacteria bacterium]MCF6230544.1 SoxR reducing system RseC family protein [Gammaproteobacteria bacterium]
MIEESATVVAVDDNFAWVESERASSCNSCAANKGCGTATLQKVMGQKRTQLKAINQAKARVGERVVIGLQEQALLKGSLYAYILPLLLLFVFAFVFEQLFSSEGITILAGLGGLLLGFVLLKYLSKQLAEDERFQAVILRRENEAVKIVKFNHES